MEYRNYNEFDCIKTYRWCYSSYGTYCNYLYGTKIAIWSISLYYATDVFFIEISGITLFCKRILAWTHFIVRRIYESTRCFLGRPKIEKIPELLKNLLSEDKKLLSLLSLDTTRKIFKYGVFSVPNFAVFGLNMEIYGVNLRIQSIYVKIQTRKNSVFGHFLHRGSLSNFP